MRSSGWWIATVAALAFGAASAQPAPSSCAEVTVNGERVPAYDCLTQKLQPAAPPASADGTPPAIASEAIAQRPGNQLGLFNRAATGHRMGNTFGTSVHPQRPATPAPVSPLMQGR